MLTLRQYQDDAVGAVESQWSLGVHATVVEMPTGTGKTIVFTELATRFTAGRILVVCPMTILVGQAARKIKDRTGLMPAIEQASEWSNESPWARSPFIVASKQTLTRARADGTKRYQRFEGVGLVIVDECHGSITPDYEEMLKHFLGKGAKVVGVTATPRRHDKRALANLYNTLAYQYGLKQAIDDGWLVSAVTQCVQLQSLDLSRVGTTGGDFTKCELNAEMEADETIFEIADVTARESGDLKTVVYCSSVVEARAVADRLVDNYKLRADWICADTKLCTQQRRQEVLASFTKDPDGIQIVCNVGILTLGWDFPGLEHIVQAKPTKSLGLFTQIFGRGTRPLAGTVDFADSTPESRRAAIAASAKPHFRMTDLVDNSLTHKIATSMDVMGGEMGLPVVERAKELAAESTGPRKIDQVLAEAQRQIQDEEQERQRLERARIEAEATYRTVTVDPFDTSQRSGHDVKRAYVARMTIGKHKDRPLCEVPRDYLRWVAQEFQSGRLKSEVDRELAQRPTHTKKATPVTPAVHDDFDDVNFELLRQGA